MNTTNTEPKSVELSNGGRAIVLPNGDISIIKDGAGVFLEFDEHCEIIKASAKLVELYDQAPKPLQFPELPEGEEWQNHSNLAPEYFGHGYRPLTTREVLANQEAIANGTLTKFVEAWVDGDWEPDYRGNAFNYTYRTSDPLPTQKEKEEQKKSLTQDVALNGMTFHVDNGICDILGKRAMAKFLRSCRVIVLQNPMDEPDPFGTPGALVTLLWGKKEGFGEVNPDGEFESYLDGKTFKVRNIVSIVP